MMRAAVALLVALVLYLAGCTRPSTVEEVVRQSGLRAVRAGGPAPFRCSSDDGLVGRSFTAELMDGTEVSGVVCCGLLKGCTVRW